MMFPMSVAAPADMIGREFDRAGLFSWLIALWLPPLHCAISEGSALANPSVRRTRLGGDRRWGLLGRLSAAEIAD